jgi:hypothetical protein
MLIVPDGLEMDDGAVMTSSTAAAAMPAANLKKRAVSKRTRLTTISGSTYYGANISANEDPASGFDLVAVIGYDGAPSRNMLRNQFDLADASWTVNDLSTPAKSNAVAPPAGLQVAIHSLFVNAGASGQGIEQTFTKPDSAGQMDLRTGIVIRQDGVNDDDLKICVEGASAAHNAEVTFDLSAGTAGAASDAGNFTAGTPTITDLGGFWYWCTLPYETDTHTSLTVRFEFVNASSTHILFAIGPVTMLQSADWTLAEYPINENDGTGPMLKITNGVTTLEDWQHALKRNCLGGFPRYSFFHHFATAQFATEARANVWDPYNALTYMEAGRLIVGTAIEVSKGTSSGLPQLFFDIEETGGQHEGDGGQIFRAQRTVRRRLGAVVRYSTHAEALDDYYRIARLQGRSRQLLVIAEEEDLVESSQNVQDGMIYGYFDDLSPVTISEGPEGGYEWGFELVESL